MTSRDTLTPDILIIDLATLVTIDILDIVLSFWIYFEFFYHLFWIYEFEYFINYIYVLI